MKPHMRTSTTDSQWDPEEAIKHLGQRIINTLSHFLLPPPEARDALRGSVDDVRVLGPLAILLAAALVLVNGGISVWLSLGLHNKLTVAVCRCVLQLTLLGYLLAPVFSFGAWWLVLLVSFGMAFVASAEAVSRTAYAYQGMLTHVAGSLTASTTLVLGYGLAVVVRPPHLMDPEYVLPLLAVMLGSTLNGIAAGLAAALDELSSGAGQVEGLLAMGASRLEATRGVLQRATAAAASPVLHSLSVAGLVSLPPFMTGQLLHGALPTQAARYQLITMLLSCTASILGGAAAVFLATTTVVDAQHRLRLDRLTAQAAGHAGVAGWVSIQASQVLVAAKDRMRRLITRLQLVYSHKRAWRGGPSLKRRISSRHRDDDEEDIASASRLRDVIMAESDEDSVDAMTVLSEADTVHDGTSLLSGPASPYAPRRLSSNLALPVSP